MFSGRISVGQYWKCVLLLIILTLIAIGVLVGGYYLLLLPMLLKSSGAGLGTILLLSIGGMFLAIIPVLIILPYIIGLQVRRFHDMGLTGWAVLALFVVGWVVNFFLPAADYSGATAVILPIGAAVAVALSVVGIVIVSWPGTKGTNKYGLPVEYRSSLAALVGDKSPNSIGVRSTPWIIWLVIILGLAILGAMGYTAIKSSTPTALTTPSTTNVPLSSNTLLAPSVFVTPKGTPTLRPPQNWTQTVFLDGVSGGTIVIFKNPIDSANSLGVTINSKSSKYNTDSDIKSTTDSITSEGGQIISTTKTSKGYIVDSTYQSTNRHNKYVMIETATKTYFIGGSSIESDWSTFSPLFNQSIATLQIQ